MNNKLKKEMVSLEAALIATKTATPEGVPANAQYVAPDEEVPDNAQVHSGPGGATYITTDGDEDETGDDGDEDVGEEDVGEVETVDWDEVATEDSIGAEVLLSTQHTDNIQGEIVDINEWPGFTSIVVNDGDREYTIRGDNVEGEIKVGDIPDESNESPDRDESVPEADIEVSEEEQESVQDESDVSEAYERVKNADDADEVVSVVEEETGVQVNGSMERWEAKTLGSSVLRVAEEFDLDNVKSINVGSGSWQDNDEYGYADPDGTVYLDPDALDEDEVTGAYYSGHVATDDPGHFVFHELGHIVHRQLLDEDRYRELKHTNDDMTKIQRESIRDGMSNYASKHPLEVVAEGFAKKMAGEELGGLNQMIYEEYGGPDV